LRRQPNKNINREVEGGPNKPAKQVIAPMPDPWYGREGRRFRMQSLRQLLHPAERGRRSGR